MASEAKKKFEAAAAAANKAPEVSKKKQFLSVQKTKISYIFWKQNKTNTFGKVIYSFMFVIVNRYFEYVVAEKSFQCKKVLYVKR